jgi:hypothetical protein
VNRVSIGWLYRGLSIGLAKEQDMEIHLSERPPGIFGVCVSAGEDKTQHMSRF